MCVCACASVNADVCYQRMNRDPLRLQTIQIMGCILIINILMKSPLFCVSEVAKFKSEVVSVEGFQQLQMRKFVVPIHSSHKKSCTSFHRLMILSDKVLETAVKLKTVL